MRCASLFYQSKAFFTDPTASRLSGAQSLEQKILQPLLVGPARQGTLRKPLLAVCITDGAPGGEDRHTIVRAITRAKRELAQTRYGPDALSVQLAQIGNDLGARQFLGEIDSHPEVGGLVDVRRWTPSLRSNRLASFKRCRSLMPKGLVVQVTSNYELEADDFQKTTGQELTPCVPLPSSFSTWSG